MERLTLSGVTQFSQVTLYDARSFNYSSPRTTVDHVYYNLLKEVKFTLLDIENKLYWTTLAK